MRQMRLVLKIYQIKLYDARQLVMHTQQLKIRHPKMDVDFDTAFRLT